MLKTLVLALPAIFCWACTTTGILTQQGAAVQFADENIVRRCQYLGDVTGTAGAAEFAQNAARNQAAAWGATHVVFVSESAYTALAHAYRCPAPAQRDGQSSDHVAKVRVRERAAGEAADQSSTQDN